MVRIVAAADACGAAAGAARVPGSAADACAGRTRSAPRACSRVDPAATPAVGRKHFPATLPLAAQGGRADLRRRPLARHHRSRAGRAQARMRAGELFPARPQRRGPSGAGARGRWPRATPSRTTPIRIRCSTTWRWTRPRPRSTAASRPSTRRSTATAGRAPRTPFFRFPGFASNPALLDLLARAASSCSAPTCGRATGIRCRPPASASWCSNGSGCRRRHRAAARHQAQTAAMLPEFLRELKRRGYRVVHVVPARGT